MNRMKKFIILTLLIFIGINGFSQNQSVIQIESQYGPYVTNRIWDNWFVTVGGGVQVYFGNYDKKLDFDKRIAPALDAAIGKWITPSTGVRFQYSGLKAFGAAYKDSHYSTELISGDYYKQEFNILHLHADYLWNISNAIGGYRSDRFWDFIPYVGVGWMRSNDDDNHENEIGASLGLLHNLRLNDAFDVSIDMRGALVDQRLAYDDGKFGENVLVSVTAGITYNLHKRFFKRAADIVVVEDNSQYVNEIAELQRMLSMANARREELMNQIARERAKAEEMTRQQQAQLEAHKSAKHKEQMEIHFPDMSVFFTINSAVISDKGEINIMNIANTIKHSPDKKFTLYASADKETGTDEYNMELSQKRAKAVHQALVDCGVDPEQLILHPVGAEKQMYKDGKLNRVVVIMSNDEHPDSANK